MMAGGKELEQLSAELDEFSRADHARASGQAVAASRPPPPPSTRWPRP